MQAKNNKEILLYTRPLAPPWDEASKNLAYDLATHILGNFKFRILTTRDFSKHLKSHQDHSPRLIPEPIFSTTSFDSWEKILLAKRLYKVNIKADLIHFLFTPRNLTSKMIKLRLAFSRAKSVQTIATLPQKVLNDPKKLRSILFADMIIAQSRYTRMKLENAGMKNVKTIYPGIDLEKFKPSVKNTSLLKNFKLEQNDFIILFAGEYTRLKAIDDVIDAFGILLAKKYPFKLICACRIKSPEDKIKRLEIIEKTKKLGYAKNIVFIETFVDMPALYNISDLNIFPVREMHGKFDIPLAVVEAMACKKPVIISDIPVLEEFVTHGITGMVVPKADPQKLSDSILEFFSDRQFKDQLSENAYSYAQENFNIVTVAKRYAEIYNSLL